MALKIESVEITARDKEGAATLAGPADQRIGLEPAGGEAMKQAHVKSESRRSRPGSRCGGFVRACLRPRCAWRGESAGSALAQTTNAPARLSYDAFRMISDRNIFNPNRYARGSAAATRTDSRPASRVESFTLVGIMGYEKGVFAFFDGTSADYKKVAARPTAVIVRVQGDQHHAGPVQLMSGTNEFEMKRGHADAPRGRRRMVFERGAARRPSRGGARLFPAR